MPMQTHKWTRLFGRPPIRTGESGPRRSDMFRNHILLRHHNSTTSIRLRLMLNIRYRRSLHSILHTIPPMSMLHLRTPQIRTLPRAIPTPVRWLAHFLPTPVVYWTNIASLVYSSSSKTSRYVRKVSILPPESEFNLMVRFRYFSVEITSHERRSVSACSTQQLVYH